jgi:hypothetical protein
MISNPDFHHEITKMNGKMRRLLHILKAQIHCHFYLLHPKRFLRLQQWTTYREGKICLIVALEGQPTFIEGTLDFGNCTIRKIFYADPP